MSGQKNVLLIDDDQVFSRIFIRDAKKKGINCTACHTVNEVTDLINYDFSAVVIDFNLGTDSALNGLDLAKFFSKLQKPMPIAIVSSSEKSEISKALPFQVKQFFSKSRGVENVVDSVIEMTKQTDKKTALKRSIFG